MSDDAKPPRPKTELELLLECNDALAEDLATIGLFRHAGTTQAMRGAVMKLSQKVIALEAELAALKALDRTRVARRGRHGR